MSKLKAFLLVAGAVVVSAVVAGAVGAGAAVALVKQAYNGPIRSDADQELVIHSDILGEDVVLQVRLPRAYSGGADPGFPVLWVLDGRSQSGQLARIADTMAEVDLLPPVIVVGVPHSGAGRTSDFVHPGERFDRQEGQADRFLEFLEDEAIPAIDAAYSTSPERLIAGHSLGALFVTYAMLRRSELFDGHLAFSPSYWVSDRALVEDLEVFFGGTAVFGEHSFFYASLGSNEGWEMEESFEAAKAVFEESAPDNLTWEMTITEGADHGDNPELSAAKALRAYGDFAAGQ